MRIDAKRDAAFDDHIRGGAAGSLRPARPLDFADDREGGGVGDSHFAEVAHQAAPKAVHPILYCSRHEVKTNCKDFAMIFWRVMPGFSAEGE